MISEEEIKNQIDAAEKMMSPLQKAQSKAREYILSDSTDPNAADAELRKSEDRLRKQQRESEEWETKDPMAWIAEVLRNAAETDADRQYAETAIGRFEEFRARWKKFLGNAPGGTSTVGDMEYSIKMANKPQLPGRITTRASELSGRDITVVVHPLLGNFQVEDPDTHAKIRVIQPSEDYRERVLRGLGVLGPAETIKSLAYHSMRGTAGDMNTADLPSDMSGVGFSVGVEGTSNQVTANLDLPALWRMVNSTE